ncbi:CU044_5270 family protein [Streptomyces sp. NBC_01803]|uniref:CU044_5270 family protein n=1 Tax=Streptomyces sp. NBC_01803 TaxID=2975946 RepID=UPI002DD9990C|nr:CU044_5270 family protein [Streptomyces sp. NBC_01803]WSA46469.1 CU044_5270 family protein [Streptomyces sp. NBC_01803]
MKRDQDNDEVRALRRLLPPLPPERDFPAGRQHQREEHLMSSWLRMGQDRSEQSGQKGRMRYVWRVALPVALATAVAVPVVLAGGDGGDKPEEPGMMTVSAGTVLTSAAAEDRGHEVTIAPRDDQFVYTREVVTETPAEGGETEEYVDESWSSVDGSQRSWIMELGHGWWEDPAAPGSSWPPLAWDELRALPTDPQELINTVRSPGWSDPDYDEPITDEDWDTVYFMLTGLLHRVPLMPDGLRPAVFEALAEVPGTETVDDETDVQGREGIGITRPGDPVMGDETIVFDADTYAYLGMRGERVADDGSATYVQWTSLTDYAVVDEAKQQP